MRVTDPFHWKSDINAEFGGTTSKCWTKCLGQQKSCDLWQNANGGYVKSNLSFAISAVLYCGVELVSIFIRYKANFSLKKQRIFETRLLRLEIIFYSPNNCAELRVFTLGFRLFSNHKSQSKGAEPQNVCVRPSWLREWRNPDGLPSPFFHRWRVKLSNCEKGHKMPDFRFGNPGSSDNKMANKSRRVTSSRNPLPRIW